MSREPKVSELWAGDLIDATRRFVVVNAKSEYGDLRVRDVEDGQVYRLFDSGSLKIEMVPSLPRATDEFWADGTPRNEPSPAHFQTNGTPGWR